MNARPTILALIALLAAGCSSTPQGVKDPEGIAEEQARARARSEKIAADAAFVPKMMIELDKALDKYAQARLAAPDERAVQLSRTLDGVIRQQTQRNFDILLTKALNPADADRSTALAALGFADESVEQRKLREKKGEPDRSPRRTEDALNALTSAIGDRDESIQINALLGMGVLAQENTPIQEIGSLLEDDKISLGVRRVAAWALVFMQPKLTPNKRREIRPILQRVLMQPLGEVEPTIAVQAIAGLGRFRNVQDAKIVHPYCEHPQSLVRIRAAIALGQIKNEDSIEPLLAMIDDRETNMNVRLAANRALQALAGGKNRGYDVAAWRRLFQRK